MDSDVVRTLWTTKQHFNFSFSRIKLIVVRYVFHPIKSEPIEADILFRCAFACVAARIFTQARCAQKWPKPHCKMISLPGSSEKSLIDVIHELTNQGFEVWDTCLGDEGVTLKITRPSLPSEPVSHDNLTSKINRNTSFQKNSLSSTVLACLCAICSSVSNN